MKNKKTYILISVLIILIILTILLGIKIINKQKFKKPYFEKNIKLGVPDVEDFSSKILNIKDGYTIYISPTPEIKDKRLYVNFTSLENNNIWLKVRVLNENKKIIAESGLLKEGEYVESLKMTKEAHPDDKITYVIMGYEINSYKSEGEIELNTKIIGENNYEK